LVPGVGKPKIEVVVVVRDVYASGDRQLTVDVLRGYFILSMASGHLAYGIVSILLHVWRWVDGAAGFVCLSGFVLGLSQVSKWRKGAGPAAQHWILRRAAQIWAISVLLTLGALSLRLARPELVFIPDVLHPERIGGALLDVALLELRVPYFGLLSMYVVFLLFAFPAVAALKRNRDYLVIAASVALYVFSQLTLPPRNLAASDTELVRFTLSAWQVLFFMGLVVGWRWKDTILPALRPWRHHITAVAGVATAGFLFLAQGDDLPVIQNAHPGDVSGYFDKFNLSPAVILYFLAVVAFLPAVIELALRIPYADRALRLVALIGRHSLANYVILCVVQALSWLVFVPNTPHGGDHIGWFVLAVLLFLAYGAAVEWMRQRRQTRGFAPARMSAAAPSGQPPA
jgi:hypothetical protein